MKVLIKHLKLLQIRVPCRWIRCQGKIDPKVIEMMYKMFPPGSAHGQSPERDALHKAAETHPDEQDFANAKEFTKSVLAKLQA